MSALSAKEKLVLERIGAGVGSRAICDELKIALPTFYTYCERARNKLGAFNTAQAVVKYKNMRDLGTEKERRLLAASEGFESP